MDMPYWTMCRPFGGCPRVRPEPGTYNADMNKPASRRPVRRTAWWVAFAALAGFLLAELT